MTNHGRNHAQKPAVMRRPGLYVLCTNAHSEVARLALANQVNSSTTLEDTLARFVTYSNSIIYLHRVMLCILFQSNVPHSEIALDENWYFDLRLYMARN